jgi:acyl-CoA thioester hydrolase
MTNQPFKNIDTTSHEHALRQLEWERPNPYIDVWRIENSHIDHYNHVNNVAYVSQLEALAWKHSNALGLSIQSYREADRGMVIQQHVLNYHLAVHLGDEIACATWITSCDKKFRLSRQFQFISLKNTKTIFSAETHFVCVSLSKGLPKKMPPHFASIYGEAANSASTIGGSHE